jgi:signal peptidase II
VQFDPVTKRAAGLAAIIFLLDQISKAVVLYGLDFINGVEGRTSIEILPFFDLAMVWNRGISYGLFQADSDLGRWLLVGFAVGLIAFLSAWLWRIRELRLGLAIGMIIGGALGNLLDRVIYGAVADFFHFHAFGYSWYVFNVADAAIVLGVAWMAWDMVFNRSEAKPAE